MSETSEHEAREHLDMVNAITLMRIYDLLLLTLDPKVALHVTKVHERGEFIGPNPSYRETIDE